MAECGIIKDQSDNTNVLYMFITILHLSKFHNIFV